MKKTIGLLLTLALVLSLVAGGATAFAADDSAKSATDFPKSAITMIIPYGAGGTSDLAGRQFEIALEKYLGVDVPVEKFLTTYEENPDTKIIGCSALLTTTMPALEQTVAAINAAPWRSKVKVMVGGAPITQEFADKIGADAYTEDAASAAKRAKELVA